jgi:hypothetical protein
MSMDSHESVSHPSGTVSLAIGVQVRKRSARFFVIFAGNKTTNARL